MVDEVVVLRMLRDVGRDEGAQRHYHIAGASSAVKRAGGKRGRETAATKRRIDLSVLENQQTASPDVPRHTSELPVDANLEARLLRNVDHGDRLAVTHHCVLRIGHRMAQTRGGMPIISRN